MWRDLSFIRKNKSLCFRLEISKMTSEVGKIKWDCLSTAHAHHIFENMTCLPGPTLIQGLWGVTCSKRATIEVEISIKEKLLWRGSWGRTKRLESCGVQLLSFQFLSLSLYPTALPPTLAYQLPLETSIPLSPNQHHLCMIHVGCFLFFFFACPTSFTFKNCLHPHPKPGLAATLYRPPCPTECAHIEDCHSRSLNPL